MGELYQTLGHQLEHFVHELVLYMSFFGILHIRPTYYFSLADYAAFFAC